MIVLFVPAVILGLSSFVEKQRRDDMFIEVKDGKKSVKIWHDLVDEHFQYTQHYKLSEFRKLGTKMKPFFKGLKVRVLQRGDCCFAHFADFDYVLENHGLTNTELAHRKITKRGTKVGHEKTAKLEDLEKWRIHFCFNRRLYVQKEYRNVYFSGPGFTTRAEMFFYDKPLMAELKTRFGAGMKYFDAEQQVIGVLANYQATKNKELVKQTYDELKKWYFEANQDSATLQQKKAYEEILGIQ